LTDTNVIPIRSPQRVINQHSNGGGSGGDGVEARIARVESDVKNIFIHLGDIKEDIRRLRDKVDTHFLWILGAIGGSIAINVGLVVWFYDAFKEILLPLINQ